MQSRIFAFIGYIIGRHSLPLILFPNPTLVNRSAYCYRIVATSQSAAAVSAAAAESATTQPTAIAPSATAAAASAELHTAGLGR